MASDEINLMLFAGELSTQDNLKHLHPELVAQIVKQVWPVAYTQGRADAWRWREIYTEGYPELMTPVLLYREGQPAMTGWVDRENDEHGAIFFSTQNGDEELPHDYFTHWLPIKLPGGEND